MKCTVCGKKGVIEVCTKCINEKIDNQYKKYEYWCILCDIPILWGYLYHHLRNDHNIKFKDVPDGHNENIMKNGYINNSLEYKKPALALYRVVK